jgi:hypothetical protein
MKKLVMMSLIVPLAMLVAFGSVSMAADETQQELNQELNKNLNGDAGKEVRDSQDRGTDLVPELGQDDGSGNPELNNSNTRDASSLAAKRGRQARRGSTAQVVADQQEYWGDNASGNDEGGDEGPDEDEEPDVTMPSN